MVEDFLGTWLPLIGAGIISLVVLLIGKGLGKFDKTSEGTLTGTIKLEHVSAGLDNLEDRINKLFDKQESHAESRDRDVTVRFQRVYDKIDEMKFTIQENSYKINDGKEDMKELKRRVERLEYKNGTNGNGFKGAV